MIFGKNITIHSGTLEFLKRFTKEIPVNMLFSKLGYLIGTHYANCCQEVTKLLSKLNEEQSQSQPHQKVVLPGDVVINDIRSAPCPALPDKPPDPPDPGGNGKKNRGRPKGS